MNKRTTVLSIVAAITWCAFSASACEPPTISASAKAIVIESDVTRAHLPIAKSALDANTELVLRDIHFENHPGTQFHVLLARRDQPARRVRVGTLSFYLQSNTKQTTTRTFDVTDELRQLARTPADLEQIDVVFEATSGRGGANARAHFDADAKLTIGEVLLRVKAK
ncbi:MAG TPA: hypothetical protein VHW00_06320 [Thermoanaerobaculia bacterium]|nr:hypothetical protein [Thermoanaerobaculia bacterium]